MTWCLQEKPEPDRRMAGMECRNLLNKLEQSFLSLNDRAVGK